MGQCRSLKDLRLLITGASQGIGKALAEEAVWRGARVLAVARSASLLDELTKTTNNSAGVLETVQADITSNDDRRRMVEAAQRYFGGLDVLINNAGIGATGHFAEVGSDRLRAIMEVNFFGLTETTRACLPSSTSPPSPVSAASLRGVSIPPANLPYRGLAKPCERSWPRMGSMCWSSALV